jgi:hypothetical protein
LFKISPTTFLATPTQYNCDIMRYNYHKKGNQSQYEINKQR